MFYKRLCDQWKNEADEAIAELERQRAATQRAGPQLHASVRGIGGRGGSRIAMSLVMSQSPLTLGNIAIDLIIGSAVGIGIMVIRRRQR